MEVNGAKYTIYGFPDASSTSTYAVKVVDAALLYRHEYNRHRPSTACASPHSSSKAIG
jgi:hypothetical protein